MRPALNVKLKSHCIQSTFFELSMNRNLSIFTYHNLLQIKKQTHDMSYKLGGYSPSPPQLDKCVDKSVLFFRLAVLFFATGHLSINFFRQIYNCCFCSISSRELSVCAIFYAFSNYALPLRKKVFFGGAPNVKTLTTSQLQAQYKIKLDFHFNLTRVRWI